MINTLRIHILKDGLRPTKRVAQRRYIASNGAIAKRDQHLRSLAYDLDEVQVLFVCDRPFNQGDIDVLRVVFYIHEWTEDHIRFPSQVDQPFIQIKKRHMTTRTATEPDSCKL